MPAAFSQLTTYTLLMVGALFPIVNPGGNTPIFLSLTSGLSGDGRTNLARMISVNGLVLLLDSIFIGTHTVAFFGISLPVVQVGGGLVVISTGWGLLRASRTTMIRGQERRTPTATRRTTPWQAFYPLTLPLTVGPGSISVAITVGANRTGGLGLAMAPDLRKAAWRSADRGVHLLELSLCGTDRTHVGRLRDERDHPLVVIHSGMHRRADLVVWFKRAALLRSGSLIRDGETIARYGRLNIVAAAFRARRR